MIRVTGECDSGRNFQKLNRRQWFLRAIQGRLLLKWDTCDSFRNYIWRMKKLTLLIVPILFFVNSRLLAQDDGPGEQMFGWTEEHLDWPKFQEIVDTFNTRPGLTNYLEKPDYMKGIWYRVGAPFTPHFWWHGCLLLNTARYKAIRSDSLGNEIEHWRVRTGAIGLGLGLEGIIIKTKPFRFTVGINGEMTNLHTDVKTGSEKWQIKNGNFILMTKAYCDLQFGKAFMVVLEPFVSTSAWEPGLYDLAKYFTSSYAETKSKSDFRERPVFIGLTVAFGVHNPDY